MMNDEQRKKMEEMAKQLGVDLITYEVKEDYQPPQPKKSKAKYRPKRQSRVLQVLKFALAGTLQKLFEVISRICFFLGFLIPLGVIYFIWKLVEGEAFTFQVISTLLTPLAIYFFGYVAGYIAEYFEQID